MRVVIEGNIGAGKTTFIQLFGEELEKLSLHKRAIVLHPEDVSRWMKDDLLQPMYQAKDNTCRSSACVAFEALGPNTDFLQRLVSDRMAAPCLSVQERHFLTTTRVFAPLSADPNYSAAHASPEHSKAFSRHMAAMDAAVGGELSRPAHVLIYLRTPAEECLRRLRSRDRDGESNIGIDNLKALEAAHDTFFSTYEPLAGKYIIDSLDEQGGCLSTPALAARAAKMVEEALKTTLRFSTVSDSTTNATANADNHIQ